MRISHGTRIVNQEESNGYGYATKMMLESLHRLGYEVSRNDPTADVEIWFDQPQHWNFSKGVYRIGYHPWESTRLNPGWADIMNECDEIWTPSPLIAEWYTKHAGVKVPVYVYEHGVDKIWTPVERKSNTPFQFLHVGGEATRKGVSDTMKAYRAAFGRSKEVQLNLKMISDGWKIPWMSGITVINQRMKIEELVRLYHVNHAFVYPSYGEGFGLTPLQAMATGMPTITVGRWAPYRNFLLDDLDIASHMVPSPWPTLHPGHMLKPKFEEIVYAMRNVVENYDYYERTQRGQVEALVAYYDWDRLTKSAFENLESRL